LQGDLLGGVHLPDLVNGRGPAEPVPRSPARGGGHQVGLMQPSLQGADGGQRGGGVLLAELHPDQSGAPGGMFATQQNGRLDQHGVGARLPWAAVVVSWEQPGVAVLAEALAPVPHGPRRQVEGFGQLGDRLALLPAMEEGSENRDRDRTWHGQTPYNGTCSFPALHSNRNAMAKLGVAISRQNFTSGNRVRIPPLPLERLMTTGRKERIGRCDRTWRRCSSSGPA
jgi:hypothetical protein